MFQLIQGKVRFCNQLTILMIKNLKYHLSCIRKRKLILRLMKISIAIKIFARKKTINIAKTCTLKLKKTWFKQSNTKTIMTSITEEKVMNQMIFQANQELASSKKNPSFKECQNCQRKNILKMDKRNKKKCKTCQQKVCNQTLNSIIFRINQSFQIRIHLKWLQIITLIHRIIKLKQLNIKVILANLPPYQISIVFKN